MGDLDYEKEYRKRKENLRKLHVRLKDTKHIQEIYHKIMGSNDGSDEEDSTSSKDDD